MSVGFRGFAGCLVLTHSSVTREGSSTRELKCTYVNICLKLFLISREKKKAANNCFHSFSFQQSSPESKNIEIEMFTFPKENKKEKLWMGLVHLSQEIK